MPTCTGDCRRHEFWEDDIERLGQTQQEFLRFTRAVEIASVLARQRRGVVSRWNSGPLNPWPIAYDFRPKAEWPSDE